jgi:formate-dependent nitrite reductase membrane component NrfD
VSAGRQGADPTYYDRPVLKGTVWVWSVPAYFFTGGASGAAAVLGAAAQVGGGPQLRGLVRRCRLVSFVGSLLGTALLIHDLGRRERFLNMLRVFRPTSPMSVGAWVLAGSAGANGGSALLAGGRGRLRVLGDAAGVAAGGLGLPMTCYTAVLFSNTAVPLWQEVRRSLPPLFAASAMASGAAVLEMTGLEPTASRVVRRFGTTGKVADLVFARAVENDSARVERVGKALREGVAGTLWRGAKVMTALSLVLDFLPGRRQRRGRWLGGLLAMAGSLSMRFAIFHAGKASARDPRATFHLQRAGYGGAEATGRAPVTQPTG